MFRTAHPTRLGRLARFTAAAAAATAICATLPLSSAQAAGTGAVSGVAFEDLNRNGVRDAGEAGVAGKVIKAYDAAGTNVGGATTASDGSYRIGNLADGTYRVQFSASDWTAMRDGWTPTTTGSLQFARDAAVVGGTGAADFGLRPIVRSTTAGQPISSFVGANGLRTESYNDVVPATALYDAVVAGGLVGDEAKVTTVRLDLGTATVTYYGASGSPGSYSNYGATVDVAWSFWLTTGDTELFHEYGHAWSMYYAYLAQQDTSLAGYLQARGIAGDSRIGSNVYWDPKEMIAEDYRQLFGTTNAATARPQANADVPPAAQVPGLRDYLATTFRTSTTTTPPPSDPAPAPAPAPAPTTTPAVSGVAMNPNPVSKTGTASFTLSADASVTVEVRDSRGTLVRTLLAAAPKPAGTSTVTWDRKDAKGRRVNAGDYSLKVTPQSGTAVATAFKVV